MVFDIDLHIEALKSSQDEIQKTTDELMENQTKMSSMMEEMWIVLDLNKRGRKTMLLKKLSKMLEVWGRYVQPFTLLSFLFTCYIVLQNLIKSKI
jgi:hypothetical protein